jgi:hypothetical protein
MTGIGWISRHRCCFDQQLYGRPAIVGVFTNDYTHDTLLLVKTATTANK